jgi:hypothetical protein
MMRANQRFVLGWAAEYVANMDPLEVRLLGDVGPAAAARGHYEPDEFAEVARWKSPRSSRRIAGNSTSDIRDITGLAFGAPERLQHHVLRLLDGVGEPTATALLAIAFPDRHTIIDVRGREALQRLGEWDAKGGYLPYLDACRRLAARVDVDLRTLDRALWQWSKDGYPAP